MKLFVILLPFLLAFGPFDSPRGLVEDGNLSYRTDNFDEAMGSYDRALKLSKNAPAIEYNRANTLVKKGEIEEALQSYQRAATSGDSSLKQKAYYNMGNALYGSGKYQEAAGAYKEALKADPKDEDAKANLEMALKKMQEQKQDSDKNGDDKNKDKNKDRDKDADKDKEGKKEGPQDKKPHEDNRQEKNDGQKGSDGGKDKEEGKQGNKGDEQKGQPEKENEQDEGKKKGEMSRTDAERLLDSLGDRNIDLQTMKDMLKGGRPAKIEKDW